MQATGLAAVTPSASGFAGAKVPRRGRHASSGGPLFGAIEIGCSRFRLGEGRRMGSFAARFCGVTPPAAAQDGFSHEPIEKGSPSMRPAICTTQRQRCQMAWNHDVRPDSSVRSSGIRSPLEPNRSRMRRASTLRSFRGNASDGFPIARINYSTLAISGRHPRHRLAR